MTSAHVASLGPMHPPWQDRYPGSPTAKRSAWLPISARSAAASAVCRSPAGTLPGAASEHRQAARGAGAGDDLAAEGGDGGLRPPRQRSKLGGIEHDVAHGGVGERLRDHEDRRAGGMVRGAR